MTTRDTSKLLRSSSSSGLFFCIHPIPSPLLNPGSHQTNSNVQPSVKAPSTAYSPAVQMFASLVCFAKPCCIRLASLKLSPFSTHSLQREKIERSCTPTKMGHTLFMKVAFLYRSRLIRVIVLRERGLSSGFAFCPRERDLFS